MIAAILAGLHLAIFIFMTGHVLAREDLPSQTRIAWVFALFFLPVLGILLYFLYGEIRFRGPIAEAHMAAERATYDLCLKSGAPRDLVRYGQASSLATAMNGFGATVGNQAELLESPDAQRARLIADIDAATRTVHVFYYIWLDDRTGRDMAQALMRAARRGVKVRAGVDTVGSLDFLYSDLWRELAEAGVETMAALPVGNPLLTVYTRRPDLRNHRKITVIDGRICHCGSQNCADPEFSPKPKYAPWIDIMVRFEGPVARQMDLLFAQTWFEDKPIDLTDWHYEVAPLADGVQAQVVGIGPTAPKGATAQLLARIIGEARREVIITTPYFAPGDVIIDAMVAASAAGAEIILNLPHRNDSGFVGPASRAYYPVLLQAGVKIFEFEGGLLHSKILTVDGVTTFMGATNFDLRSFDLNFENDILLRDPKLSQAIRARQHEYLGSSIAIDPAEVAAWPFWKRIWYNAFTIVGPLI